MTDYGTDCTTFVGHEPDLDPSFGTILGPLVVAESVARRLLMPGGFAPDAPGAGTDLRAWLSASTLAPASLAATLSAAIKAEAEKDERVYQADVTASADSSGNVAARLMLTLSGGESFGVVMDISQEAVSVSMLERF